MTLALLVALGYYAYSQPAKNLAQFHFNSTYLLLALALLPLNVGLRAYKWMLFVKPVEPTVTYSQSLSSYLGAIPLSLVTPGKLGEFSRCLYFPQKSLHKLEAAGLVMLDNWTDFLAVVLWSIGGFYTIAGLKGASAGLWMFLVFYPIGLWLKWAHTLMGYFPTLWGLDRLGRLLRNTLPKPLHIPQKLCLSAIGVGFFAYAVEWTQFYLLIHSVAKITVSPWLLTGLIALVTLGNSVQITFAGLGMREWSAAYISAAYIFSSHGITPALAVAATFMLFIINLLCPALLGLCFKPRVAKVTDKVVGTEKKT